MLFLDLNKALDKVPSENKTTYETILKKPIKGQLEIMTIAFLYIL